MTIIYIIILYFGRIITNNSGSGKKFRIRPDLDPRHCLKVGSDQRYDLEPSKWAGSKTVPSRSLIYEPAPGGSGCGSCCPCTDPSI